MRRVAIPVLITALAAIALGGSTVSRAQSPAAALPVVVFETAKGTIEMELWPAEAPKSVAHVLALVRKGFYRGLRFHWINSGVIQIGDPASRDMTRKGSWGLGGSGTPIGVEEYSKKKFVRGSVGLAPHRGSAKNSDSQIFILKTTNPTLDGKNIMLGRVTKGMDVVDKIDFADVLKNATVK